MSHCIWQTASHCSWKCLLLLLQCKFHLWKKSEIWERRQMQASLVTNEWKSRRNNRMLCTQSSMRAVTLLSVSSVQVISGWCIALPLDHYGFFHLSHVIKCPCKKRSIMTALSLMNSMIYIFLHCVSLAMHLSDPTRSTRPLNINV